jgi:hypothetical protein
MPVQALKGTFPSSRPHQVFMEKEPIKITRTRKKGTEKAN